MADEPNPRMDRLLREYAEQRRKRVGFPLHPTTRQILQGEVGRAFRKYRPTPIWTRWRNYLPQISFAGGLGAIFLIAVLSMRNPPREQTPAAASAPPQGASTVDALTLTDATRKEESAVAKDLTETRSEPEEPVQLRADSERVQLSRTAAPAVEAPSSRSFQSLPAEEDAAAQSAAKPRTTENLGRANEMTNLGAALRLRFVELPDRSRREARPQILTSFQVEQSGEDLRFLDRDGSVYTGQLFPPADDTSQVDRSVPASVPALTPFTQDTAVYSFQAQGTNRTLAKSVLLQGRYLERTNGGPAPERTFSFSADQPQTNNALTNLPRLRRAIIGRATVAETNHFSITAVSAEP
jgi:hypothetical protein